MEFTRFTFTQKDILNFDVKKVGDAECKRQGRIVFTVFDGDDRLPGHAQLIGQRLLREVVHGAKYLQPVFHLLHTKAYG
jgi:hypothetical protein